MDEAAPELSVIVPTDRFTTMRSTAAKLRGQTALDRLELVIVTPSPRDLGADRGELEGFHSVTLVESDVSSMPRARAAGVRAASAELVAFSETHAFPEPRWAEAMIDAHRGPWAGVGPVLRVANPGHPAAWGNFFVDYGRWAEPLASGPVADLPGHNSSYKRFLLLDYGSGLESMLTAESVLHEDLRRRGYGLYLEPGARVRHLNMTRLVPAATQWFHYSRGYAAMRSRRWSRTRRLAYAAAAPLIPLVRFVRTLRQMRRAQRLRLLPRALPAMICSLAGGGAGELVGYTIGGGESLEGTTRYELHRARFAASPARPRGNE
jgi:hypothetical protein